MSQAQSAEDHYKKQRRHDYHASNLGQPVEHRGETAEILRALSEIDDLPINPEDDPVMGQLVSELTSTANLSEEERRSNEWVREYIQILNLCQFPDHDGMHGSWRGYAHADEKQALPPLDSDKRMMLEAFVSSSKLALSRSQDAKVIEESVRNVNESIVSDGDGNSASNGNGLIGKLGLK